ncbi:hypothetical protein C8R43DRAFT_1241298 [Mycena crocata]|nr:hypothetical protein C8R43DRAFT_1241298 [Mycena crocata]
MEMLAQVVGIVPTLIIVRVGLGVNVQSIESTVKAAAAMDDTQSLKRDILGNMRPGRDVSYSDDVEKGKPYHGSGKPQPF